jgi:hypothetical protein
MLLLDSCFTSSLILKVVAIWSSETSSYLRTTRCFSPENRALEITSRISLENSVQNLPSSCFQSKNIKNKTCEIIILNIVLCRCGTRFLTIREENILRKFVKRDKVIKGWSKLHSKKLHAQGVQHTWER